MIGINEKGQFVKGRIEPEEIRIKRIAALKDAWKERIGYHGMYGSKIHTTWRSMKNRCDGTSSQECNKKYHHKGISYCKEWADFIVFLKDMGDSHFDGAQLDRIDNKIGYNKDNCRWVTPKQNSNNRTNNVRIEYNNMTKTLSEWADFLSIPFSCIRNRYYNFYKKGKYGIDELFRK